MATSADELLKNDNFQIPLIDLQRFCQDELNTAARLFGDFPETKFSSMVSPKIDKSIFNESAGSRRQTYSGGRVSRRRKEPILNSNAKEDSQEISMSSLVSFSSRRGKSGSNKNSSKSILDLVGKFLHMLNKEEKNRLNARSSLSSYASEERDVPSVPLFKELKEEDHNNFFINVSPNIEEAENICEILRGDPEMEGEILEIQKSFENAEGLEEHKSKALDNARPDITNARKRPQVSKEDSELKGGMGRFRMLSEGLERSQEDQNKVAVESSPSIAESGNASEILGRDTEGGIWGIRKLLESSDRLQEGQHKVVVNVSPHLLETNCTSEVLRGSLEMEEDIGKIKNSFENFEGFQVLEEITERSEYVRPELESKVSGEENIDTQHGLQVRSQERQSYEQVQGSLKDFDRLVETSELQNRGKVYEKQSQVDNFCPELHRCILNAGGDIDTVADGMDRPKRKRGRPKRKTTEWGSALSTDIMKEEYEKELASDAMNQAGEHLASASRKRVRSGSPCSAPKEDAGDHFSSYSRKRVYNGLSRGASKDGNELGVETQFYHRKFSSEAATATLDGKEVSSDASVASDIIAKPTGPANDRATNGKCKVDVTERSNAAAAKAFYTKQLYGAKLKKEKLANRKNEHDMLRQMSLMKKQKLLPADDFLESWKNRLPNGWKVEVGLQRIKNGKYDYYHKFVSPDGVQFPELKETSKYGSSVCRKENDVKGSSATNEIQFCPAGYRGSNQRSDILYEEDRNEELNTSSKLDSPESMSIPSDSDEARVEAHIYACKLCGKNFNSYRHYVGHVAAHSPTSHRKRGRPRLRSKLQNVSLLEKKEEKDDQIISIENLLSTSVNESDNPDKPKRKVGKPRVRNSDRHKEMHSNTGIQSGRVMFYVNQAGSKGNVNEPQNSNIMDMDCGHAIQSGGTPVLVNTAGPRKPGRPRKIKEPICGYNSKDDDMNHTSNNRDDFVDTDRGHVMQSAGTPILVNTFGPKRKRGRPRTAGPKRKRGRPRKIKEPICSNDNHDDERNYTDIDRDEVNISLRSYQDVEENLSVCEQSASLRTYIDRDACEKIGGSPRYGDTAQDEVHYSVDTDCDHALQSAGTPVLVHTVGPKRKPGRPRTVRPKRKAGRPRKIKEPICSNDSHDNERNYSGNDRNETNNSFRSYQDVEENLSMCKQSAGLQTSIDRDAREKIEPPRCGDKTQDGVHYFADTDCCSAMQSAGTPVLVNTVEAKKKPGQPKKIEEPICCNNHGDERNCSGNDRDEANNSFCSYEDVKENLSPCKQFAGLQTSIDRAACEKKDGLPRYGHKTQDEVHYEKSIKSVGALVHVDQDEQNNWAGQQRLRDDNKDTTGDSAAADPSLKRDDWSRLKDEMQVKDMDCSNDPQPLGAQVLVTRVGEKKRLGWPRKFQVPICSDSKLDNEINNYSSNGHQDEERHGQCDNQKDDMRFCLDRELNFSKIDQSMQVMAPVLLDRSENFIGMQKLGRISQDEEMPRDKTCQYGGLVTNLDPDEQNKWSEQPRVKDDRQDVEPSYDRINQSADSKNPVDSTSPLLENINLDSALQEYGVYQNSNKTTDDCFVNLDSALQEYGVYQNSNKTTDDCFAEAGTLFPLFPAVNVEKLDPSKIATGGNAQVPFADHGIEWDPSQFVVCQWCDQDFDFSSLCPLGSPCSWICPVCKTVNNVSNL